MNLYPDTGPKKAIALGTILAIIVGVMLTATGSLCTNAIRAYSSEEEAQAACPRERVVFFSLWDQTARGYYIKADPKFGRDEKGSFYCLTENVRFLRPAKDSAAGDPTERDSLRMAYCSDRWNLGPVFSQLFGKSILPVTNTAARE